MKVRFTRNPIYILACLLGSAPLVADEESAGHWPSFRGHRAEGVAHGSVTPATWNVETGENVRWKQPIPGLGHSSPVIWGERIFLTTAIAEAGDADLKVGLYGSGFSADDNGVQSWRVYSLDKTSGEILWERTAHEGEPRIKRHPKATHANSTPATDGQRVVGLFGSEGLYTYDLDGKLLWKKDLGVLHSGSFRTAAAQWGFGASPVLHDGKVVIQADVFNGSFLAVFDAADGRELWRTARDEYPTWSTPTVYEHGEQTLILVNGYKHMGAYDFATGGELWRLAGGGDVPVPTPIAAHGLVYLTNAHGAQRPVYAIRPGARGDISLKGDATSNDGIAWSVPRGGTYMQTPLIYGDELYVCRGNGVLYCYDAKTGALHYETRLASGGGFTASPVASKGKIYFTSEVGETYVIRPGTTFEQLGKSSLGETTMATPAISQGVLYFRTRGHVVAVAEDAGQGEPSSKTSR